eukprot:6479259-Amphidinium_carterae.1
MSKWTVSISHDKDGIRSLEARGALGRRLSIDYFGSGETIFMTESNRLVKGLKLRAIDENVLRVSRSWNKVEPRLEGTDRAVPRRMSPDTALPGGDEGAPEERPDPLACSVTPGLVEKTWSRVDQGVMRFVASKDGGPEKVWKRVTYNLDDGTLIAEEAPAIKHKSRMVICGNRQPWEADERTSTNNLDAALLRWMLSTWASKNTMWTTVDISTAFPTGEDACGTACALETPNCPCEAGIVLKTCDFKVEGADKALPGASEAKAVKI